MKSLWALRLAAQVYCEGPGERLLEMTDLFYRLYKEDREHTSDIIFLAAADATKGMPGTRPGQPSEIVAWVRVIREYVKTGEIRDLPVPEPLSEAS